MEDQTDILRRLDELEREVFALRSRSEIENLIARYQHYRSAGAWERLLDECWAKDRADVTAEVGPSGVFTGLDRIGNAYRKRNLPGRLTVHAVTTPDIEVTGEAARGLWLTIGSESDAGDLGPAPPATQEARALLTSRDPEGRAYRAEWVWQKFEADFVPQNDRWKILHLHVYEIFRCPFDTDWVRFSALRRETDGLRCDAVFTPEIEPELPEGFPREYLPEFGSTFHWQYAVDAVPPLTPEPPAPADRET